MRYSPCPKPSPRSWRYKDAIMYLRGVMEGKIRPEKLEKGNRVYRHIVDQAMMGYAWVA